MMQETIFRENDIRGTYPEEINELVMKDIAIGIAKKCKSEGVDSIAVARDGRLSGEPLLTNFCEAILNCGIDVNCIGLATSPMLYFAAKKEKSKSGIMITGSHNPKDYNGFKIVLNQNSFFGEDIQKLGKFAKEGYSQTYLGLSKSVSINDQYIEKIIEPIKGIDKKLANKTIVWDCGNGASGPSVEMLTKRISGNHIVLFSEVDGNFPNHHPDPTDESTLKILSDKMKEVNADIGIGFDGDGDRIGVIDKKGRPIAGDLLTAFLSNSLEIKDKENQTVILDIKSSYVAYDKIISFGLNAEIGKTGHSNIKKRIKNF